ncbi:MAG TPA: glycosyltransferase family 4 protein [Myxococcales bacterium]|nr:glycosyltransferase family 4 protein [Myxococcales bacterium]
MAQNLAKLDGRRVALIHDWLVTLRGGERVLDAFCELFPEATVMTLVRKPGVATPRIEAMRHETSFVDKIPGARSKHRWMLPLYPQAIEGLDLSEFDLILSSSHCVAKAVIPAPGAVHVCYSHTPVRYAWDRTDDYIDGTNSAVGLVRPLLHGVARWLRDFDQRTLGRVDHFIANSENTAQKIRRFYQREVTVVHPPVEMNRFEQLERAPKGYDLVLSGLVPYKRVDLAVEAYRHLPDRRLVVVGDGPELQRLRRIAPDNVEIKGRVEEQELAGWYQGAQLLVFPGEEDFGIVPLEAQAAGVPVVAFGRGGALKTVVDGETGILFDEQTPQALATAIAKLSASPVSVEACRAQAKRFDRDVFIGKMQAVIEEALRANRPGQPGWGQ